MYVNFNLRFECVNTKPKNCDIILEKQKCKYLMNKLCQNKKKNKNLFSIFNFKSCQFCREIFEFYYGFYFLKVA